MTHGSFFLENRQTLVKLISMELQLTREELSSHKSRSGDSIFNAELHHFKVLKLYLPSASIFRKDLLNTNKILATFILIELGITIAEL